VRQISPNAVVKKGRISRLQKRFFDNGFSGPCTPCLQSFVTERCSDTGGSGWTTGQFKQAGSQVSATVWVTSDGAHIRVYCTYQDKITEWCNDPNTCWTKGSYTVA